MDYRVRRDSPAYAARDSNGLPGLDVRELDTRQQLLYLDPPWNCLDQGPLDVP
jgi:hypothetical protein